MDPRASFKNPGYIERRSHYLDTRLIEDIIDRGYAPVVADIAPLLRYSAKDASFRIPPRILTWLADFLEKKRKPGRPRQLSLDESLKVWEIARLTQNLAVGYNRKKVPKPHAFHTPTENAIGEIAKQEQVSETTVKRAMKIYPLPSDKDA